MGKTNIRNREATTELAGPGWGRVTARESQRYRVSSPTGLSAHSHGRSRQGRGGSSQQAEFQAGPRSRSRKRHTAGLHTGDPRSRDAYVHPTGTPALQDRPLLPPDSQLRGPRPLGSVPDPGPDLLGRDPSQLNEPVDKSLFSPGTAVGQGMPWARVNPTPTGQFGAMATQDGGPRPRESTLPVTLAPPSRPHCLTLQL